MISTVRLEGNLSGKTPATRGPLFCPVARALDLMGDRWTLVLIRHLLGGPRGFQDLRTRTGIGPRVLTTRLRQMRDRGFVQSVRVGSRSLYALTTRGQSLQPIVREIARWWVLNAMERHGPFRETRAAFQRISAWDLSNVTMRYLSMGMSNSYRVAIEEGANIVRIGTKIFGRRPERT